MSELREKIRAYLLRQIYLQEDHATDMADAILPLMREEGVDLEGAAKIKQAAVELLQHWDAFGKEEWRSHSEGGLKIRELYSSLPFLTFRLPFRLFDLVPHFGGGDPLVLRTVGEDAAGDRVEGFQDFSHAIRAL